MNNLLTLTLTLTLLHTESSTKSLEEQNPAADLASALERPDKLRNNWLVIANTSETKLVTFQHHRVEYSLVLMRCCIPNEDRFL